ncbi:MAG TPA: hypothetical protein DCX01_00520 [Bacteroidetes bacterium]|nr:hypothetical protein [Bacteroidota bacterium]
MYFVIISANGDVVTAKVVKE